MYTFKIQDDVLRQIYQTKSTQLGMMGIIISIQSLRHLEHQNLTISNDHIHSSGIIFQFQFCPSWR